MNHLPSTAASKLALSTALQHGFIAVLIFALIAVAATLFLKDVPLKATQGGLEIEERAELADDEPDKELVHV